MGGFLMSPDNEHTKTWADVIIERLLHPIIIILTLLTLVILNVMYIWDAFQNGAGIQSLAATLVPIIIATFLHQYSSSLMDSILGRGNAATRFVVGFIWSIGIIVIIVYFEQYISVPLSELMLSSTFSLLVFSSVNTTRQELSDISAYYYGIVVGVLVYVMLFGIPPGGLKTSPASSAGSPDITRTPIESTDTPSSTPHIRP